jgi:Holliday junction resolvase
MATPEVLVKKKVRKLLDEAGVYYFMPPANGFGRAGIPDIVGCLNGCFFAIECKAGKGTTTALQDREISRINDAGGTAIVVNENNLADVLKLMEKLNG